MSSWQRPRIPEFASQLDPSILQLHVADYRNPGQLQARGVLVVGAGNSGAEVAIELARTHDVWLSGPDTGHLPFRPESVAARILMPFIARIIFHPVLTTGTPIGRRARPTMVSTGEPVIRVKPKDLAAAGVERVPRVTGVQHGQPQLEDDRRLDVANVVWCTGFHLDRLDRFVETVLIPEYTRGVGRADNPAYEKVKSALACARKRGDRIAARELRKQLRRLPSRSPRDPDFRRLHYTRYADDHLLGFTGPKAEAEQVKARLTQFLRDDLKLELNETKTLITHARTQAAKFLGYEITVQHANHTRRTANGVIGLRVPKDVIKAKSAPYMKRGKPDKRPRLVNNDAYTIITTYGAEYRGLVNYYLLAGDVYRLNRVHWVMRTSLLKTLACKYNSSVSKMANTYQATIDTPHGPRTCLQTSVERDDRKPLTARFGGIPLKRQKNAILHDRQPAPATTGGKELISRLLARRCEMCQHTGMVDVHHVGKLAHLDKPGQPPPAWAELMAKRRRKTLVVCAACHELIHARQPTATPTE